MSLKWDPKDPDETLDYTIDWSDRMAAGDTISTCVWTVPAGLTKTTQSISNAEPVWRTTAWLSGGTIGTTYEVLAHITTAAGRIMDQTVKLKIKAK